MASGVNELIEMLYSMVTAAWGIPLGNEKCVVERDKVLELLDEIKAQLPTELSEAKRLMNARNEFILNAKKEADSIKKVAEDQAKRMVDEEEILKQAKQRAADILASAENKSRELRRVANEYADDTLRRTEEAIGEAFDEVRQSRARFRNAAMQNTSNTDINVQ